MQDVRQCEESGNVHIKKKKSWSEERVYARFKIHKYIKYIKSVGNCEGRIHGRIK